MKNICIVSSQYLPHVGGVENYVARFSKELVRLGHQVTIVTSLVEGCPTYEENEGRKIYRLPSLLLMDGRFPVLLPSKELGVFDKIFKKSNFDVVLVNTRFYLISLYAVRLAKKNGVRCILLDHGTSHLNAGNAIVSKLGEWFEHGITFLDKIYCKEFAGVSKATLEWVEHFGIHSDRVLYNAIDDDEFARLKGMSKCNYREQYHIPENAVIISFVGRLTLEKGVRELVYSMKRILEERDDVWLLLAGAGYLQEELEGENVPHVHFLGQLPMVDVVEVLEESDIFCLPSVSEGFPTCVLEAAICDNYIITTFRGGAKECISDKEYGLILPDNNEEGLTKALLEVINQETYRKEAASRCKERVLNNYTWKQTVQAFLSMIDERKEFGENG